MNFYVYAYLNQKTLQPYYIGKGCKNRINALHHGINLPPNPIHRVILEDNLTEIGAFALERRLIKWYGRKVDNSGILLNQTEGGEGSSGVKQSSKTIQKRVRKNTGQKRTPEQIANLVKGAQNRDNTNVGRNTARPLRTPDGIFKSMKDAATFYNVTAACITYWLSKKEGWKKLHPSDITEEQTLVEV